MAQDADVPKAADKGKGKAIDDPKNENAAANGKKETDEKGGMLYLGDNAPPRIILIQLQSLARRSSTKKISSSRVSSI